MLRLVLGLSLFALAGLVVSTLAATDVFVVPRRAAEATGNTIAVPDSAGDVGAFTSLQLDASGHPVVAYYDITNGDLKLLRCNDSACLDGDDSITAPDTTGQVGYSPGLVLDALGHPVVAYLDITTGDLKVLHCNDPNCAGASESIQAVVPYAYGYSFNLPAISLDGIGNPVIAFPRGVNYHLGMVHCNDPDCAGGDDVVSIVDPFCCVQATSLALDAAGNPVVAYGDGIGNGDLRVLHCGDSSCSPGTRNISNADSFGSVGATLSFVLDSPGNPVVAYLDSTYGNLKLLHCNDPACTGNDESMTWPDSEGYVGVYPSLELDGSGNPVMSYWDGSNGDLKVVHCDEPNCTGGDESIAAPDTAGNVGSYASLAIDNSGNPTVSYYDTTNGDLKILHCGDRTCKGTQAAPTATPCASCRPQFSIGLDSDGDGTDDCSTRVGPTKCAVTSTGPFYVNVYLDELPTGISTYQGFNLLASQAGSLYGNRLDTLFACGSFNLGDQIGSHCEHPPFGGPLSYTGLIATVELGCVRGGAGSVALIHGSNATDIVTLDQVHLPEAEKGFESLQISVSCPTSTPTNTPTATATPCPAGKVPSGDACSTPTRTNTPSVTASPTRTPTVTPTSSATVTATYTRTSTPTPLPLGGWGTYSSPWSDRAEWSVAGAVATAAVATLVPFGGAVFLWRRWRR